LGGISAIALLIAGLGVASAAGTGQGQGLQDGSGAGDGYGRRGDNAHATEMQDLMDSADYDTWRAAVEAHAAEMGNGNTPPVLEDITEDNFDQFKEMHELMQAGDREAAAVIAEELGLPERGMKGQGTRRGNGDGMGEGRQFRDTNGDGVCDNLDVEESQN